MEQERKCTNSPIHIQRQFNRESKTSSTNGAGIIDKNKSLIYENCCLTVYLNSVLVIPLYIKIRIAKPQKHLLVYFYLKYKGQNMNPVLATCWVAINEWIIWHLSSFFFIYYNYFLFIINNYTFIKKSIRPWVCAGYTVMNTTKWSSFSRIFSI